MKNFIKFSVLILLVGLVVTSCQKEETEFIEETPDGVITTTSILAKLLQNVSQNNGGIDDFIDKTPCSSIQFPYQVIINGQTITIQDESDLANIAGITSPITIVFPITVVFQDFSTLLVNNQQELDTLAQVCEDLNEAIDCIDLVYPVTFFVYDSNNEQIDTVDIQDDAQLFSFLSSLNEGVYVAFEFPISVTLADGSVVNVTSNSQLQGLVEDCEDIVDPLPLELVTVLTTDSWFVSFYFDDENQTSEFIGYEFVFNPNGTATATIGSNVEDGIWSISTGSNGTLKLDLEFDDEDPLKELEEDWKVIDFTEELIRLKHGNDFLSFSRTPFTGGGSNAQQLRDILTDGNWFVALFLEDGEDDETSDFDSFNFNFIPNGQVVVTNTGNTLFGTWFVEEDDEELELVLNFDDAYPLDELDDDWFVMQFNNSQIELWDDEDDDDADILIFEKL